MNNFTDYLANGHAWLYVPIAILLGALHGLEPGHSKTMMAAFIIAIRGTVWQAVLLGLSAAISHSLLIWILAALALHYGGQWNAEHTEPYFHLASAVMIFVLAVWMFLRTRREGREAQEHAERHHHPSSHAPATVTAQDFQHAITLPEGMISNERLAALSRRRAEAENPGVMLDTGHGWLRIQISAGDSPRFRIHPCRASGELLPMPKHTQMKMETSRLDGSSQTFQFEAQDAFWESTALVPQPHEFAATLMMGHEDHAHTYRLRFHRLATTDNQAPAAPAPAVEIVSDENDPYQDAHERAHAEDIARRFANRAVTTPQIVLFGITGGLMPCPAAFTILVVCLQIKKVALGFALVAAFSLGLALTMVTIGAVAAWSVNRAQKRFSGFGEWMRRAPYISCALLVLLAAFMAWQGWQGLSQPHAHITP
jgi:nickel/cobalt exporter